MTRDCAPDRRPDAQRIRDLRRRVTAALASRPNSRSSLRFSWRSSSCATGTNRRPGRSPRPRLDAMGWGGLYDEVDGGFFRYATTRDWQLAHFEKLLEVNAALLRLYLEAGSTLEIARFSERAADMLRYVQTWLADPVDGGWWGAQQADADYYAAGSVDDATARTAPPVGSVLVRRLECRHGLGRAARRTHLRRRRPARFCTQVARARPAGLLQARRRCRAFVRSAVGVRGLLADQFAMASASLDVFEVTGNIVYEMMAEELAHYAVRTMWDEAGGGFFDRAEEAPPAAVGLMRRRLKPFALNCDPCPRCGGWRPRPASTSSGSSPTARSRRWRPLPRPRARLPRTTSSPCVPRWSGDTLPDSVRARVPDWRDVTRLTPAIRDLHHEHIPFRPQEHRHAAPHRLGQVDDRSRQRPPDDLLVGGRHRRGAVLRRDALRSEESAQSRQRSLRAVEGPRRADSVRGVGRSRRVRSRASC